MEVEFTRRVGEKRAIIKRMKQKLKEYDMKEATMICERCLQDVAPMRTLDYINDELHYAKCVFGSLKRVELSEVNDPIYAADKEFVEIYINSYDELRAQIRKSEKPTT